MTTVPTEIWTIQLGQWRLAREHGIKLLDITAKSGIGPFAPDFNLVMQFKQGKISTTDYTRFYLERMERSRQQFPNYWKTLKIYPQMAFACYCTAGAYCHRLLFAKEAENYLVANGLQVIQRGELTLERLLVEQRQLQRGNKT